MKMRIVDARNYGTAAQIDALRMSIGRYRDFIQKRDHAEARERNVN
jgi:hypothetical protein